MTKVIRKVSPLITHVELLMKFDSKNKFYYKWFLNNAKDFRGNVTSFRREKQINSIKEENSINNAKKIFKEKTGFHYAEGFTLSHLSVAGGKGKKLIFSPPRKYAFNITSRGAAADYNGLRFNLQNTMFLGVIIPDYFMRHIYNPVKNSKTPLQQYFEYSTKQ